MSRKQSESGAFPNMTQLLRFEIPAVPPTLNHALRRHWTYRAELVVAWTKWVVCMCSPRPTTPFVGPLVVELTFHRPGQICDPDNAGAKYVMDGLVKAGVIADDSWPTIDALVLRARRGKPARTVVAIHQTKAPASD